MKAGEIVAGRFQIETRAGAGASGTVYRAVDVASGARVALKVFAPFDGAEQRLRFDREVGLLAGLVHPAIVEYVAHGEVSPGDTGCYLAMEWLEGCTLAERIETGPLDLPSTLQMIYRVAEGVAAAHRAGILHRDLKPANLFLRRRQVDAALVLDFGLARAVDATRLTRTGALLGTPLYMSPEQARGQADLDPRTDVFSLGAILYRCLTGKNPFYGDQVLAVLAKILVEEVKPPRALDPTIPPEVEALTMRMLAKDPAARPADAGALLAELADLQPGADTMSRPRSPTTGITHVALRPLCAVLSRPSARGDAAEEHGMAQQVRAMAAGLGGRLETLADGSYLVIFLDQTGTEQLYCAARCALLLRDLTGAPVAVAAGRATAQSALPLGEALDRAARAVAQAGPGEVAIDASMAGALESRFSLRPRGDLLFLRNERGEVEKEEARTFLGRPTALVGREPELALLTELCTEAIGERCARAALLLAPAGTGKSRLCAELLRRVLRRHPDTEILRGRGDGLAHGSPFAPLAEAIRRYAGIQDGGDDQVTRERLEHRLGLALPPERVAVVTDLLSHLLGLPVLNQQFTRSDAHLRGAAMRHAFVEWLAAETACHPVLLVLDDLHWADRPSVEFVDTALRELASAPFVVIGLGRPETSERFPDLWKQREVERIALPGLKRNAALRLARAHLGEAAPDELLARIVERAAGNAFFLEELIRAAVSGKSDALPDSVLLVLHQRLDELSPEQKRALRAASVFGRIFWSRGVAALLGDATGGAAGIDAALSALERREIIERLPRADVRGEIEYAFEHALVQEVAYATLTDEDRVHAHRLAGEWLEERRIRDPIALAEHYTRGGLPARAAQWFLQGALQALEGSDPHSARQRAERGLACAPDTQLAARLWLAVAEAESFRASCRPAAEAAQRAAELCPEGSALWFRAMDERFYALARLGAEQARQAGEVLERIRRVTPAADAQRDALLCLSRAAILVVRLGRHHTAGDLVERIATLAGSFYDLDAMTAARVHSVRGLLARDAGDAELCLQAHAEALQAAELAGDRPHACLARISWGSCLVELGAAEQGAEMLRTALAQARGLGAPGIIAIACLALGECSIELCDWRGARELAQAAAELGRQIGEVHLEGRALLVSGRADLLAGEAEHAAGEMARAVELVGSFPAFRSVALARLSQARLATGDRNSAQKLATEARDLWQPTRGFAAEESTVMLAACEVAAACDSGEESARLIGDALERLRARSERLSPSWQIGFLRLSENARLLELARERDL